jgi:hypothetical protein
MAKQRGSLSGVWIEYWWAKFGEKEGSRKVSYHLSATGTPYVVADPVANVIEGRTSLTPL